MSFYKEISARVTQAVGRYSPSRKQLRSSHMIYYALSSCLSTGALLSLGVKNQSMWSFLIFQEGKPAVPFRHLVLSCPLTDQLTQNKQQRHPPHPASFRTEPRKPLVGCSGGRKWLTYRLRLRGICVCGVGGMHARTRKCLCQAGWCLADEAQTTRTHNEELVGVRWGKIVVEGGDAETETARYGEWRQSALMARRPQTHLKQLERLKTVCPYLAEHRRNANKDIIISLSVFGTFFNVFFFKNKYPLPRV